MRLTRRCWVCYPSPRSPWPSRKIRILLFLLWQMIAEPPLGGDLVTDLTEPVSPRGKKQGGEIRKRRREAGAGHPLKRGESAMDGIGNFGAAFGVLNGFGDLFNGGGDDGGFAGVLKGAEDLTNGGGGSGGGVGKTIGELVSGGSGGGV